MKTSRFSESQILNILKEGECGVPVNELCRKYQISTSSYYKWRSRYGGVEVSELKRLKEVESENRRLKKMYAELSLLYEAFKDAVSKKL